MHENGLSFTITDYHSVTGLRSNVLSAFDDANEKAGHLRAEVFKYYTNLFSRMGTAGEMPYALFQDEEDGEACLVMQTPFGTGLKPREQLSQIHQAILANPNESVSINKNALRTLVKSDFLHRVLKLAGVRGPDSKPLKLLVAPGPSVEYNPAFSKEERSKISKGDFTPYATRVLGLAQELKVKKMVAAGYSRGGRVALNALELAQGSSIMPLGGIVAETPYQDVSLPTITHRFTTRDYAKGCAPQESKGSPEIDNPEVLRYFSLSPVNTWEDNLYANGNKWNNCYAGKGLARSGGVLDQMANLASCGIPLTVAYGLVSGMTPGMHEALHTRYKTLTQIEKGKIMPQPFEGPHITGENIKAHVAIFTLGAMAVSKTWQ